MEKTWHIVGVRMVLCWINIINIIILKWYPNAYMFVKVLKIITYQDAWSLKLDYKHVLKQNIVINWQFWIRILISYAWMGISKMLKLNLF